MIDFVIIGFGRMGQIHYRALKRLPGARVKAVCDPSPDEPLNEPFYQAYEDLMKQESFDAAVIASPNSSHAAFAADLIKNNKHILIEKPVAVNITEATELLNLSQQTNVKICTSFTERFNPIILTLFHHIQNHKIKTIETFRSGPSPGKRNAESVLLDLGVHDIDLVRFLTEAEIIHGETNITRKTDSFFSDQAIISLNLTNKTTAELIVQWHPKIKKRTIQITAGDDIYSGDLINYTLIKTSKQNTHEVQNELAVPALNEPAVEQLKAFIRYIRTGQSSGIATLEDGVRTLEVAGSGLAASRQ
jgi:UDP-N-acetylglucosamine 3-dehydrogenase